MKLYTEEQVKDAFFKGFYTTNETQCCVKAPADVYCRLHMQKLTPIELPSDEEIKEKSKYWNETTKPHMFTYRLAWENGVKWLKECILNQKK